jgi:hypothetical protein
MTLTIPVLKRVVIHTGTPEIMVLISPTNPPMAKGPFPAEMKILNIIWEDWDHLMNLATTRLMRQRGIETKGNTGS